MQTLAVQPTLTIEMGPLDWLAAWGYCVWPGTAATALSRIEQTWAGPAHTIVSLSLRSGFDLYLQALALPPGSDVLMAAVTHPDMVAIVRAHGLVPVPVDVDPETMAPRPDCLAKALSGRSRALVVTHLFGGHFDVTGLVAWCRRHDLRLIEDCAQTYGSGYRGHPDADVALVSFGPIKTGTALGCAVATVRDAAVRERMVALQAAYPVLPVRAFIQRLLKYGTLTAVAQNSYVFGVCCHLLEAVGRSPGELIRHWLRSFDRFDLQRFRWQPPPAMLRLLARRLATSEARLGLGRRMAGDVLAAGLPGIERPGRAGQQHGHWIFPILVDDPEAVVQDLRRQGVLAMPGLSNLATFDPPAGRPELRAVTAERIVSRALLLPIHSRLTPRAAGRMAEVLRCGHA